uniref:RNA polymerase II transcription factor n=1 Tax=Aurantimonas manganoxydans TaxID=651183 RepID=A0A0P0Z5U8_9HYPH|nr:RNA polymerase II transcription factor [Aurantimonas manganoxydans SI85-9A1]
MGVRAAPARPGIRRCFHPANTAHMANSPAGEGAGRAVKAKDPEWFDRVGTWADNASSQGSCEAHQAPRSTKRLFAKFLRLWSLTGSDGVAYIAFIEDGGGAGAGRTVRWELVRGKLF